MPKIKLHYPNAIVIEATLREHLSPTPGDIVLVFDPNSICINTFTILNSISDEDAGEGRFVAPFLTEPTKLLNWTYAYKVPEGYASVETSND